MSLPPFRTPNSTVPGRSDGLVYLREHATAQTASSVDARDCAESDAAATLALMRLDKTHQDPPQREPVALQAAMTPAPPAPHHVAVQPALADRARRIADMRRAHRRQQSMREHMRALQLLMHSLPAMVGAFSRPAT